MRGGKETLVGVQKEREDGGKETEGGRVRMGI